jgi:hypothetical protein
MVGLMNNTKWDELRLAMYRLGPLSPQYRIKDRELDAPCAWDGEWFYHFRLPGYDYADIEWVDLKATSTEQREAIRNRLREIHVPGRETAEGFRVLGWVSAGETVSYID